VKKADSIYHQETRLAAWPPITYRGQQAKTSERAVVLSVFIDGLSCRPVWAARCFCTNLGVGVSEGVGLILRSGATWEASRFSGFSKQAADTGRSLVGPSLHFAQEAIDLDCCSPNYPSIFPYTHLEIRRRWVGECSRVTFAGNFFANSPSQGRNPTSRPDNVGLLGRRGHPNQTSAMKMIFCLTTSTKDDILYAI